MALKVRIIGKDGLSGKLSKIGGRVGRLGKKFAKFGVLAGAVIAGASIKIASEFDKGLREVSTLMDDVTEKDIKGMSKELKKLATVSGDALSSLVKAKYDIVSAGFSDAADSALVLKQSAELAVGGVTSTAKAADLLTTALNAYGLEASDVESVSDTMFTTVKYGKTTMDELAESMGQVLPFAKAGKLSLDDVGASMATLTASGIKTTEATTALKGMILALSAPAKNAADAMEKAGVSTKYLEDGQLDLIGTIKQFQGLDVAAIKKFIPNIRAGTAVITLANNFDTLQDNMQGFADKAGTTDVAFAKMQESFSQKGARLKQNFIGIMDSIGQQLMVVFEEPVRIANETLSRMGDLGWGNIGKSIMNNWQIIMGGLVQLLEVWAMMIPDIFIEAFKLMWKGLTFLVPKIFKSLVNILRAKFTLPGAREMEVFVIKVGGWFNNLGVKIKNWAISVYTNVKAWFAKALNYIIRDFINPAIDALNDLIRGLNKVNPFSDIKTLKSTDLIDIDGIYKAGEDMKVEFIDIQGKIADAQKFYNDQITELMDNAGVHGETFGERLSSAMTTSGSIIGEMFATIEAGAQALKDQEETALEKTKENLNKIKEIKKDMAETSIDTMNADEVIQSRFWQARLMRLAQYKDKWKITEEELLGIGTQFWELYAEQEATGYQARFDKLQDFYEKYYVATGGALEVDKWYAGEKLKIWLDLGKKIGQSVANYGQMLTNFHDAEINNINRRKDKTIKGLEEMGLSEEELAKRKAKAEGDAEDKIKAIKRRKKQVSKMMAIVKGAEAVMDTFASWGGYPAGIIPAAIMAGVTASQVALIDSQSFKYGGRVTGGGDTVPAMLTPREIVSTQSASDIYGDDILRMNQLADGEATSPMGGQMNITIQAMDSESFEGYIRSNPEALVNAMDFLRDKRYLE